MLFAFGFGLFLGALAVLGLEVWVLLLAIERLRRKSAAPRPSAAAERDLGAEQSVASSLSKQGVVWILEPEKVPKLNTEESTTKGAREPKNKKNILEVYPVKKYAKIKDRSLTLSDPDGSHRTIELLDCTIVAVSASDLPSRKWAKRYPIRLESRNSALCNGSKMCYMFFETSWEKESWCKALRLASCPDRTKLNWFSQLSGEFHNYLTSLTSEYPSFLKPPVLSGEAPDRTNKIDASSSKVRGFLKKLAKKASKNNTDSKLASHSSSTQGERRSGDRVRTQHDVQSYDDSPEGSESISSYSLQDPVQTEPPSKSRQATSEKILNHDEGTLCWNLLFSRLFFDAKRSIVLNDAIKAHIQRTLSNMRTPGYIGGITCTGLDLGSLPPYIRIMRVLPMDLSEVWAMEVEVEYSGGMVLDIETRIEVGEHDLQKDDLGQSLGLTSSGHGSSDLLDGVDYGSHLELSGNSEQTESRDEGDRVDGLKQSRNATWASNYASRWKAAVHSLANRVAQVPLSLAIRITSLQGTLRLHIMPPPSDQIWFGFTSMPEIEMNFDSSVGDQKITSSHVALLIGNRLKASIRDTLVLPNCGNICIPWMLAEKDDWVPHSVAPYIWIHQEAIDMAGLDSTAAQTEQSNSMPDGSDKGRADAATCTKDKVDRTDSARDLLPALKADTSAAGHQSVSLESVSSKHPIDGSANIELMEPLLRTDENQEVNSGSASPKTSSSSSENSVVDLPSVSVASREPPKRIGSRRAKMLDLGKRMGEKLEEKRRQIEEKSRHVVEKMRENARTENKGAL